MGCKKLYLLQNSVSVARSKAEGKEGLHLRRLININIMYILWNLEQSMKITIVVVVVWLWLWLWCCCDVVVVVLVMVMVAMMTSTIPI